MREYDAEFSEVPCVNELLELNMPLDFCTQV